MDAVVQFEELSSKYSEILKSFPEFSVAENIYKELIQLRSRLTQLEDLRIQEIFKIKGQ